MPLLEWFKKQNGERNIMPMYHTHVKMVVIYSTNVNSPIHASEVGTALVEITQGTSNFKISKNVIIKGVCQI